ARVVGSRPPRCYRLDLRRTNANASSSAVSETAELQTWQARLCRVDGKCAPADNAAPGNSGHLLTPLSAPELLRQSFPPGPARVPAHSEREVNRDRIAQLRADCFPHPSIVRSPPARLPCRGVAREKASLVRD